MLLPEKTIHKRKYPGQYIISGCGFDRDVLRRRILYEAPPIPNRLGHSCRDLLFGLMHKEKDERLGANGAHEVKSHRWFSSLNWDDVLAKRVRPPFKPYVSNEMDVGNFADEFTNQEPVDSPALPISKHNEVFRVSIFPPLLSIALYR